VSQTLDAHAVYPAGSQARKVPQRRTVPIAEPIAGASLAGQYQPNLHHSGAENRVHFLSRSWTSRWNSVDLSDIDGAASTADTTTMRASSKLFLACLAVFALAGLCRVPPGRAATHATHGMRHAARGTVHRLAGRHLPAGTAVMEASVDDDDDGAADDDAGHRSMPACRLLRHRESSWPTPALSQNLRDSRLCWRVVTFTPHARRPAARSSLPDRLGERIAALP
jgi:hypothetical protein